MFDLDNNFFTSYTRCTVFEKTSSFSSSRSQKSRCEAIKVFNHGSKNTSHQKKEERGSIGDE